MNENKEIVAARLLIAPSADKARELLRRHVSSPYLQRSTVFDTQEQWLFGPGDRSLGTRLRFEVTLWPKEIAVIIRGARGASIGSSTEIAHGLGRLTSCGKYRQIALLQQPRGITLSMPPTAELGVALNMLYCKFIGVE